jgi:vancomycin aglycone glucosyltransferase
MRVVLSTYGGRGDVRVADLGIGAAHAGPAPTTESLSAGLSAALTPETRARAAAVAGTIRTDGAAVAAKLLLDAVSRGGAPYPDRFGKP